MKPIEKLKKGEIFFLPNKNTPYVYNGYNRFLKKYEYHKFFDISAFGYKKKGTIIDDNRDF
jgi:hypothetical protein